VGPAHPWVEDSPQPDWFHGTKANHSEAVGTFQTLLNPHAPWRDREKVLDGWFVNLLPDMNQENPAVSRYLIQNTLWWIEEAFTLHSTSPPTSLSAKPSCTTHP
jgi:hypothetical protein